MSTVARSANEVRSRVFYCGVAGMIFMAVMLVATPFFSTSLLLDLFEPESQATGDELVRVFFISWAIGFFTLFTMIYRRNLEHSLKPIHQLAEVGQTAARVAHDLRCPIGALQTTISSLRLSPTSDTGIADWISILESSCQRLEAITNDLLGYYGSKQEARGPFDLHEVLRECLSEVRRGNSFRNIEWVTKLCDASVLLSGKKNQLGRVFLNLIKNAAEAVNISGVVTVVTRLSPNMIVVEIQDTGRGLTSEQIEAILSGKPVSNKMTGHGIGLNFVREAVAEHNGALKIRSVPGATIFSIHFSRAANETEHFQGSVKAP